jgi:hypothetical protein
MNQFLRPVDRVRERFRDGVLMRARPGIAVLCVLGVTASRVRGFDFPYDDLLFKSKLFLHPFVNHEIQPSWLRWYEDSLFSSTLVKLNYGSVALRDLMTDLDVVVNAKLDHGVWFRFEHRTFENNHLDLDERSNFAGAEKIIAGPLSAFCYANFMFDKEFADVQVGVAVGDSTRSRYARLAVCLEDFMYDAKNSLGGRTEKAPYAAVWQLNQVFGRVRLFSEGNWSRGFERTYPDRVRSPEIAYHRQYERHALARCVYTLSPRLFVQAEVFHYRFGETQRFGNPANNYRFENVIYHMSALCCLTLRDMHRFRIGPHVVVNRAAAEGFRDYEYTRSDIMPLGGYEFIWRSCTLGAACFASMYHWDVDSHDALAGGERRGYVAKGQATCDLQLWKTAHLRGNYSHVLTPNSFDGWTVQYIMLL